MVRNLLLVGLLLTGALYWLLPTISYLELVNPLGNPIPRYNMELALIITYAFTLGSFSVIAWLLLWMNQYESPAEIMIMALIACFGWDLGVRYSVFTSFYYNEPVPYSISVLLFHLIFTSLFGAYLYIHEEWNRLNFEAKLACYLQSGASLVLLVSLFSNPFVGLIYCFASMVSLWLGLQSILSSSRRSLKMNLIAVLIPIPGFLILAYLLLAPHVSHWAGAKIMGYRPEGFYTKLSILGKPLSEEEQKILQLTKRYHDQLKQDASYYQHSAKYLVLFFLLGIALKTRKRIKPEGQKTEANLETIPPLPEKTPLAAPDPPPSPSENQAPSPTATPTSTTSPENQLPSV